MHCYVLKSSITNFYYFIEVIYCPCCTFSKDKANVRESIIGLPWTCINAVGHYLAMNFE